MSLNDKGPDVLKYLPVNKDMIAEFGSFINMIIGLQATPSVLDGLGWLGGHTEEQECCLLVSHILMVIWSGFHSFNS